MESTLAASFQQRNKRATKRVKRHVNRGNQAQIERVLRDAFPWRCHHGERYFTFVKSPATNDDSSPSLMYFCTTASKSDFFSCVMRASRSRTKS